MISFVVAAADNGVMAKDEGGLPWRQKTDMLRFRDITKGRAVIMGRKTQQELEKPLPDRLNIVLTRDSSYEAPGYEIAHSVEEALEKAAAYGQKEIMVIGGSQIFDLFMPRADKIYLTEIHADTPGDTRFHYDPAEWREVDREDHPADENNEHPYSFVTLERIKT